MAMTKAEKAAMDAMRQELAEARALRWLGAPPPVRSVLPPSGRGDPAYRNGWEFNAYTAKVFPQWTESVSHGAGHRTDDGAWRARIASQNGRALYATKLDATIALRLATEARCAQDLARIDAMIAAEVAGVLP
jgi:hypothetical protein